MAIEKTINAGGVEIKMRASALIPRLYRAKFGRDMVTDLRRLQSNVKEVLEDETDEKNLDILDLTIFENVAWIMAKHADPAVPSDPDEWLESIPGVLSVYECLPEILELWSQNTVTTSVPRKK